MAVTSVLDLKGKQLRDFTLCDEIFARADQDKAADGGSVNKAIDTMHAALMRQMNNARVGSANTKTRAEVRGGGAKPWRQKGTGRARAGSRRSPLWAGGGVTFGPKPRDYSISMPTKKRHSAIKSALAVCVDNIIVVESFAGLKEVKTKAAFEVLQALKIDDKKVLVVLEPKSEEAKRFGLSVRNIKNVSVVRANNLGVKDILDCQAILTSQTAMEVITKWLAPEKSEKAIKKASIEKFKVAYEPKKEEAKKSVKIDSAPLSALQSIANSSVKTVKKVEAKVEAKEPKSTNEKSNPTKKLQSNPAAKSKKDNSKGGSTGGSAKNKGKGK